MKQLFFIICLFTFSTSHIIDAMENSDQEICVITKKPGNKHPVFIEKENPKSPGKKTKEVPARNNASIGKRLRFGDEENNVNESPLKKYKSNDDLAVSSLNNLQQIIHESNKIDEIAQILTEIKTQEEIKNINSFINDIKKISESYAKNGTLPTKIQRVLVNNYPNLNINNVIITVEEKNNRQNMHLIDFITALRGYGTFKYLYKQRGAHISENTIRLAGPSKKIAEFLKINGHEIEIPQPKQRPSNMTKKQFIKLNSKESYNDRGYRIV
jgi:hypothetical protein